VNEHIQSLLEEPAWRRCWLLHKALECLPLDRAIELARTADAFVTGSRSESARCEAPVDPASSGALPRSGDEQPPSTGPQTSDKHPSLALSPQQRETLLDRLARGARNSELGTEFGLSSKQIQGIRMGCARDIAKRRERLSRAECVDEQASVPASVDDVIRYLRQQDDVVVPQKNNEFLVNGRFQLPLEELIARANRMRGRNGKRKFELAHVEPKSNR